MKITVMSDLSTSPLAEGTASAGVVPRIGEMFSVHGTEYSIKDVAWEFDEDGELGCFLQLVDDRGAPQIH